MLFLRVGCGSKPFWDPILGVNSPPSLVYCSGDWDVHWYRILTHRLKDTIIIEKHIFDDQRWSPFLQSLLKNRSALVDFQCLGNNGRGGATPAVGSWSLVSESGYFVPDQQKGWQWLPQSSFNILRQGSSPTGRELLVLPSWLQEVLKLMWDRSDKPEVSEVCDMPESP